MYPKKIINEIRKEITNVKPSSRVDKKLRERVLAEELNGTAIDRVAKKFLTIQQYDYFRMLYKHEKSAFYVSQSFGVGKTTIYNARREILNTLTSKRSLTDILEWKDEPTSSTLSSLYNDTTMDRLVDCRPKGIDPRETRGFADAVRRIHNYLIEVKGPDNGTIETFMKLKPDELQKIDGFGLYKAFLILSILEYYGFKYAKGCGYKSTMECCKALFRGRSSTIDNCKVAWL